MYTWSNIFKTYCASLFVRHIYRYIYTVKFRGQKAHHYLSNAEYLYIKHKKFISNTLAFILSLFIKHTESHYLQEV